MYIWLMGASFMWYDKKILKVSPSGQENLSILNIDMLTILFYMFFGFSFCGFTFLTVYEYGHLCHQTNLYKLKLL